MSGFFAMLILLVMVAFVFISYKSMREKEMKIENGERFKKLPSAIYRRWYALTVLVSGFFGSAMFMLLSLTDPEKPSLVTMAMVGFYMLAMAVSAVLFIIRPVIYNGRKDYLALIFLTIIIGIGTFPFYYIYNLVCIFSGFRTEKAETSPDINKETEDVSEKEADKSEKVFEDYFSEIQEDIVSICLEYVEGRAEKIYIICSFESNVISHYYFYKVNGVVVRKHRLNDVISENEKPYDVSVNVQSQVADIIDDDIKALIKLCRENNRDMPTEIKLVYDIKANKLNADYSYEPVYSNSRTKTADTISDEWFEEMKAKEGK